MKLYKIKTDIDFQKVAVATLKKVFSVSLFPRVLTNLSSKQMEDIFSGRIELVCVNLQKSQKFAHMTHFSCFDLGLYFFKKSDVMFLKVFDGTGHLASSFVTNIFDKVFSLNIADLKAETLAIQKKYDTLDKSKLLVQQSIPAFPNVIQSEA